MMKEFEIATIGDGEGVDMGSIIEYSLFLNVVFFLGELFYRSMLCKWTTSLADFAWVICQWKPS